MTTRTQVRRRARTTTIRIRVHAAALGHFIVFVLQVAGLFAGAATLAFLTDILEFLTAAA
jgi:hypothetical protein